MTIEGWRVCMQAEPEAAEKSSGALRPLAFDDQAHVLLCEVGTPTFLECLHLRLSLQTAVM